MSETFHLNRNNEVVTYIDGHRSFYEPRQMTGFEEQLISEIEELKEQIEVLTKENEYLKRIND